jgi:hypothetical protein
MIRGVLSDVDGFPADSEKYICKAELMIFILPTDSLLKIVNPNTGATRAQAINRSGEISIKSNY